MIRWHNVSRYSWISFFKIENVSINCNKIDCSRGSGTSCAQTNDSCFSRFDEANFDVDDYDHQFQLLSIIVTRTSRVSPEYCFRARLRSAREILPLWISFAGHGVVNIIYDLPWHRVTFYRGLLDSPRNRKETNTSLEFSLRARNGIPLDVEQLFSTKLFLLLRGTLRATGPWPKIR